MARTQRPPRRIAGPYIPRGYGCLHQAPRTITRKRLRRRKAKDTTYFEPKFPHFTKLPTELRLRIWEMAIEEPRVVAIELVGILLDVREVNGLRSLISPSPVPAVLHLCSESRQVALKKYKLCFGGRNYRGDAFPARIYFNFNRDILYFRGHKNGFGRLSPFEEFIREIDMEDLSEVKHFGFDIRVNLGLQGFSGIQPRNFAGIESFFIAMEDTRLDLESEIAFCPFEKKDSWAFRRTLKKTVFWMSRRPNTIWDPIEVIMERSLQKRLEIANQKSPGSSEPVSLHFVTAANR